MPTLRVASILCGERDLFAIDHHGKLLNVSVLEQRFALDASPSRFTELGSFRARVFSLSLAGLYEIAESLGESRPPAEAVLNPAHCAYLPPTIATAALLEFSVLSGGQLTFRRGYARCLRGQDALLPIPTEEASAQCSIQIAAILGEDLRDATVKEATRAIVGFAPMTLWTFPSKEKVSAGWGQYRLGQLGPCLVIPQEPFNPKDHDVRILVNGHVIAAAAGRQWTHSFGEMIAFASDGADLFAGDVIASGPIASGPIGSSKERRELRAGDRVTAEVSGLGTLSGVFVT